MSAWNDLIDNLMPTLTGSAWMVACYLYQATELGTQPVERTITNIQHQAGLDRHTIIRALLVLKSRGIIRTTRPKMVSIGAIAPTVYTWIYSASPELRDQRQEERLRRYEAME